MELYMKEGIYPRSYEGDESYAFISYAHKDSATVWPIIDHMDKDGYRIWYDDGIRPGTEWDDNVAEHIQKADYFVAFISEDYIKSDNCRDELNYARDLNKARVLIYIEKVELPGGLAMRLKRLQSVRKYKFESDEEFYEKLYQAENITICKRQQETIPAEIKELYEQIKSLDLMEYKYNTYIDIDKLLLDFSKELYSVGVCEINTEIKYKFRYLQMMCTDFKEAFVDRSGYVSFFVKDLSLVELQKRYETYLMYVSKYQIRIATFTLSVDRIREYENYFREIDLNEEQIKHILADLIEMGDYAKRIDKVKKTTEKLECFNISRNRRNQLMVKAAMLLYNDFLRKTDMVIDGLIEENGKEKAYEILLNDPELLRIY